MAFRISYNIFQQLIMAVYYQVNIPWHNVSGIYLSPFFAGNAASTLPFHLYTHLWFKHLLSLRWKTDEVHFVVKSGV